MVAEMIIRIPDYEERKRELQYSYEEYETFGIPRDYIQAAARWRRVVEFSGAVIDARGRRRMLGQRVRPGARSQSLRSGARPEVGVRTVCGT